MVVSSLRLCPFKREKVVGTSVCYRMQNHWCYTDLLVKPEELTEATKPLSSYCCSSGTVKALAFLSSLQSTQDSHNHPSLPARWEL